MTSGVGSSVSRYLVAWLLVVAASGAALVPAAGGSSGRSSGRWNPLLVAAVPGVPTWYVLAARNCGERVCLSLWRTSNDGSDFERVSAPPASTSSALDEGDLNRLVFSNERDGFALVGPSQDDEALYVTTDGARTWRRDQPAAGETVVAITATPSSLYATTARCGTASGASCSRYELARRSLSASRWTLEALSSLGLAEGDSDAVPAVRGARIWFSEQSLSRSLVFASSDDGASFRVIDAPMLASVSGCGLSAWSARALWAQCPTGMMESFFHSTNGGATWARVPQQAYFGTGGGFFEPVSATLAFVDYGDDAHRVYRLSEPKGSEAAVGALDCSDVPSVAFADPTAAVAVCERVSGSSSRTLLEITTDAAARWRALAIPDT